MFWDDVGMRHCPVQLLTQWYQTQTGLPAYTVMMHANRHSAQLDQGKLCKRKQGGFTDNELKHIFEDKA